MLTPNIQHRFWTSLGLSLFFSFISPVIMLGGLWIVLLGITQVPWTNHLGNEALSILTNFLATFGSGQPLQGMLVVSSVAAIVGGLFDTYASALSRAYRYH